MRLKKYTAPDSDAASSSCLPLMPRPELSSSDAPSAAVFPSPLSAARDPNQSLAPLLEALRNACSDHVPPALIAQLKVGGRLVIPVGGFNQEIRVITKTASGHSEERLIPVRFVPLTRDVREEEE